MNSEAMNQQTRERVARSYEKGNTNDIIAITTELYETGHQMGYDFGSMIQKLRDCGIKPDELSVALCLALANIPDEKLNEIDLMAKKYMKSLLGYPRENNSSTASQPFSADIHHKKNVLHPELPKETWFFGEMQLDLSKSYDNIFDNAFDIAENCGYMVTKGKDCIQLYGEDCNDSISIVNTIYFVNGKVSRALKHVIKDGKSFSSRPVEIVS